MLRFLRKTHLYFGLFIAPSLLFFAFTGAVQTLSLHEGAGADYKPPALLVSLGQLHKKQTYLLPQRRPPASNSTDAAHADGAGRPDHPHRDASGAAAGTQQTGAAAAGSAAPPAAPIPPVTLASKQKQHLPLKIFFLLVSLGLFTSTLTGIYMAYKYERGKLLVSALLLLGLVIPILLARF